MSSVSLDDCVCDAEFYDAIVGPGVECALCPVGTNCSGAATLDRLPIQPGYWRLDATTTDVRKCPDAGALWPRSR